VNAPAFLWNESLKLELLEDEKRKVRRNDLDGN
jgi:hypothetical protein